jgi:hypothetical protein
MCKRDNLSKTNHTTLLLHIVRAKGISIVHNNKKLKVKTLYIQFFKYRVSIALQHALAYAIERKIALVRDACSKPPIIIKFQDFHVGDIRGWLVK